jgi:hypothetical protein
MATFTSSACEAAISPKGLRVGLVAVTAAYSVANSLSLGSTIQMVKVPANATPVYVSVLNTNAGQATLSVGDGLNNARYRLVATTSASQGVLPINTQYIPYTYSTDDTLDIYVSLVSVSTVGGAFYMTAIFSMDPESH